MIDYKHQSPERGEDTRPNKSRPPGRDDIEKESPVIFASQPARRIRGKSKGPTISDYTETRGQSSSGPDTQGQSSSGPATAAETQGQSSSGPATAAEIARGRQPERDFKNVATNTIMKQVSIAQLRKLLK